MHERFVKVLLKQTSRHPLETIAGCLFIAALCYFSLIHLFHFTEPSHYLSTQTILLNKNGLVTFDNASSVDYDKILLRQFIIDVPKFPTEVPPQGILAKSVLKSAHHLLSAVKSVSILDLLTGKDMFYSDLCALLVF